jgi:predicted nucleotidyltransferase
LMSSLRIASRLAYVGLSDAFSNLINSKGKSMTIKEQIEEIVNRIVEHYQPRKIILFGSYAYGVPAKDSDLDLLVVKDTDLPRYKRAREIRKYLWGISEIPKDIIVYTQKEIDEWKEVDEAFITSVVKNGKILYEEQDGAGK